MDKYLIEAYRHMLIEYLRDIILKWKNYKNFSASMFRNTENHYKISVTSSIIFDIHQNKVGIFSNELLLYTFKNLFFKDIRLFFEICKFLKIKKKFDLKEKERILNNNLSDDYKRSIKLSKIKDKM